MALRIASVQAMIRVDPKSAREAVETLLEIAIRKDTLVDEMKSLITEFDHERDGAVFCLKARKINNKSPFDIPGIKTKTTTEDILNAVRDSRGD